MRDHSSDDDRPVTEKWKRSSRTEIQKTAKDKKMAAASSRREESGKLSGERPGQDVKYPFGKKTQEFRDRGQAGRVDPDKNNLLTGREFSLPTGSEPVDTISPDIMHQAGVISNQEAKKRFQRSRQVLSFSEPENTVWEIRDCQKRSTKGRKSGPDASGRRRRGK